MFARVKKSRNDEYLQIIESYRDQGRVRQRVILYVGHYASVSEALERMPKNLRRLRTRATRAEKLLGPGAEESRRERQWAEDFAAKLDALRRLVEENPSLIERDHERAERHDRRKREAMAQRRRQAS